MKHKRSVLLDTSFFLRFLNDNDPLFKNADGYFRHFLEKEIDMMISTISIAEYCVGGSITELPLKNLQVVPFNLNHALRTGEFAQIVYREKNKGSLQVNDRKIIPNDSKLFAQADSEKTIEYYLSSDIESLKIYDILRQYTQINFQFLPLSVPAAETFGLLDFGE